MNEPPCEIKPSHVLAVVLAFLPSLVMLLIIEQHVKLWPDMMRFLILLGIGSCFWSSYLMFRGRPVYIYLCGVFFVMLNAVISVFIGCTGF